MRLFHNQYQEFSGYPKQNISGHPFQNVPITPFLIPVKKTVHLCNPVKQGSFVLSEEIQSLSGSNAGGALHIT